MEKTNSFTMADPLRGGTHFGLLKRIAVTTAFTMAEILLSLAVIGIIAAMTLPTLTANFQDRAFNAKRQALHARLANAFRMMDYNDYQPININSFMDELGKSMSIKVVSEDGFGALIGRERFSDTNDFYLPITDASPLYIAGGPNAYFQTVNGENIGMMFNYANPLSDKSKPGASFCILLVYDLNGKKGPNKYGKDMGVMGAFYPDNMELFAPMLAVVTDNIENEGYEEGDPNSQKYKYPDYRLATPEEIFVLLSLFGKGNSLNFLPDQIDFDTPICAIDGKRYSLNSLNTFEDVEGRVHLSSNIINELEDDGSSCLYMLVTNDGSAPKNGVITDISSEDSGE